MRFVCIVHHDESWFADRTPAEMKTLSDESAAYDEQVEKEGKLVVAEALRRSASGKIVRARGRKRTVTDGPFAETKEQMIGFLLIEASDMNEAVEIAGGIPLAATGAIEVREAYSIRD